MHRLAVRAGEHVQAAVLQGGLRDREPDADDRAGGIEGEVEAVLVPRLAPGARVLEDELREEAVELGPDEVRRAGRARRPGERTPRTRRARWSLNTFDASSSGEPSRPTRLASGSTRAWGSGRPSACARVTATTSASMASHVAASAKPARRTYPFSSKWSRSACVRASISTSEPHRCRPVAPSRVQRVEVACRAARGCGGRTRTRSRCAWRRGTWCRQSANRSTMSIVVLGPSLVLVGDRLVGEEDLRSDDGGSGEGDALLFAEGDLVGEALREVRQPQLVEQLIAVDGVVGLREAAGEVEVLAHRELVDDGERLRYERQRLPARRVVVARLTEDRPPPRRPAARSRRRA